jgi:hypothetical protein
MLNIWPNLMNVVPNSSKTRRILSGAEASNSSTKFFRERKIKASLLYNIDKFILGQNSKNFFKSFKIRSFIIEPPEVHYIIY